MYSGCLAEKWQTILNWYFFFFLKAIKQGHAKDKDTTVMEDELETLDAKTNQKLVGFYNSGVKIDLKLKEMRL